METNISTVQAVSYTHLLWKWKLLQRSKRSMNMEKSSKVFVRIKPFLSENIVTSVESTIVMESASYKKGDIFDVHPVFYAGCAMAGYTADDFQMQDDTGTFGFTCEDSMGDFGPQRTYRFDRDVTGRLVITYRTKTLEKNPNKADPGFSLFRTCLLYTSRCAEIVLLSIISNYKCYLRKERKK